MNTLLKRKFTIYFIESRFISIIISIGVILMRFFMYSKVGLDNSPINAGNFVWNQIEPFLQEHPFMSLTASTISVFMISFLISEINNRFGIIRTRTSMPFYIPLLIFSLHPDFLRFTPYYPALIFVLWSMFPLLSAYQSHVNQKYTFKFSALLAIASLFQIYAIILVPLWLIALKALSEINFRTLLSSIFGIATIYWISFAFYVFADNIYGFVLPMIELTKIYDFTKVPSFSVPQWGFICTFVFLILYFIIVDSRQITRERSFTKKALYLSQAIIIISLILHALFLTHTTFWIYTTMAYTSIIIAHYYTNITSSQVIYSFIVFISLLSLYLIINTF